MDKEFKSPAELKSQSESSIESTFAAFDQATKKTLSKDRGRLTKIDFVVCFTAVTGCLSTYTNPKFELGGLGRDAWLFLGTISLIFAVENILVKLWKAWKLGRITPKSDDELVAELLYQINAYDPKQIIREALKPTKENSPWLFLGKLLRPKKSAKSFTKEKLFSAVPQSNKIDFISEKKDKGISQLK